MSSFSIQYGITCRNCNQDSGHYITTVMGEDVKTFLGKTSLELSLWLEKWRRSSGHGCAACGSTNNDIENIHLDGKPVYSFRALAAQCQQKSDYMFNLNISKQHGQYAFTPGQSHYMNQFFLRNAFNRFISSLDLFDKNSFVGLPDGNFYAIATGGMQSTSMPDKVILHRLNFNGFAKQEIINNLVAYANYAGIDLN